MGTSEKVNVMDSWRAMKKNGARRRKKRELRSDWWGDAELRWHAWEQTENKSGKVCI